MTDYRYQQRKPGMPERNYSPNIPDSVPAMLYVPMQTDSTAYDEMTALEKGTLFPCLDKPFKGKRCR